MNKHSLSLLSAALTATTLFSFSPQANAATTAMFTDLAANDSVTLQLDKFDNNGGLYLLTGVTISLIDVTISADVQATNDEALAQDVSVNLIGGMVSAVPGINLTIPTATATFTSSAGPQNIDASQTHDFGTLSGGPTTVANGVTNPPDDLSAFIAPGGATFDIDIQSSGAWGFSGTGDVTLSVANFDSNGTVQVEYFFTVVPEPSRALLLCLGVCGAAFVRRRPASSLNK